jgi:GNAT superfamily N-acetyltransferase
MAETLHIRKAREADLPAMMSLLRACARDMQAAGIDQWDETFPPEDFVRKDIVGGTARVAESGGQLCGMFTMDEHQAPEYGSVRWLLAAQRVAVVHRLAVSPAYHRKGIASQMMDFVENEAAALGYDVMRLDTYSRNNRAVELYLGRGYSQAGEVHFRNKTAPFLCFEKRLAR